ncbi:hypothetical protein MKW98_031609 [Papaver atlanticum]|uniref:GATA-type domain-containing protein n=1 Tax=Papaver atlanticum TaxID=357466 RepID=A0AAD4S7P3_9MAGN|nr:hypothetical protein MKW98_031609 [Papaver atlanticum]
MSDLTEKGSGSGSDTAIKSCVDCKTSKTPLWRGGPAGPKSLCNACGIRQRKKRRAMMGLQKEESDEIIKKEKKDDHQKEKKDDDHHHKIQISSKKNKNNKIISASLKLRLLAFGREVMLQRSAAMGSTQRQPLGEEEQAAVLLMALSCESVYA